MGPQVAPRLQEVAREENILWGQGHINRCIKNGSLPQANDPSLLGVEWESGNFELLR